MQVYMHARKHARTHTLVKPSDQLKGNVINSYIN